MYGVKKFVKQILKVLPGNFERTMANKFHFVEALIANIRFGFPARNMRVIMITGTNGKTTTASYVANILKAAGYKVGVCTTAYFDIGDKRIDNDLNATAVHPMKLQKMLAQMKSKGTEFLVLEVTSHALEQYRVWGVPCEVAVMTNLTQDHLDYHGTMDDYAAAKAKLFAREPRYIVLNRDDQWFAYFNQFVATEQKITYGTSEDAECRVVDVKLHRRGTDMTFLVDHQTKIETGTQLPGKFNVYNSAAAVATAYLLRVDIDKIQEGIESLEGVPGRQERVQTKTPYDILVDYAHTPDALEKLLESLKELTKSRLILVFGATGDRDKTKRPIMGAIAAKLADRVIVTDEESYSEEPAKIRAMILDGVKEAGGNGKTDEVADRREAIKKAITIARPGDTVVITGMGHEKFRIENGERVPWNDAEVVKEIIENK